MPTKTAGAPERSLVQRMEALNRANQIRMRRAELKRDLKAGRESLPALLLEPPEYVHSAKVFDLMLATPKYGRVKVNKVLQLARISPSKTIGGLSPRQRTELVCMLRGNWSPPLRNQPPAPPPAAMVNRPVPTDPPPTTYERRVLNLAADLGEVNRHNMYAAAEALGSNPRAVIGACDRLRRNGLMTITGAPTAAGRTRSTIVPAA